MRFLQILLICCLACWVQLGIASSVDERDMKAALLYNFSVYTSWPNNEDKEFNICIFEADQENLNESLLESKVLSGKPVRVRNIHHIDDVKTCQVLFVEEANISNEKLLQQALQKHSILFVHNSQKLTDASMIRIELVDKRYHFSINNQAVKEANLTLSSKLLRLATRVY